MRLRSVVLFAGFSFLFTGCMTKSTESGLNEATLADAYAQAVCAQAEPCCNHVGYGFSSDNCYGRNLQSMQAMIDEAQASGARYNPNKAQECLDIIQAENLNCARLGGNFDRYFLACGAIYSGNKAPGAACSSGFECDNDVGVAGCENGKCARRRFVQEYDSCVASTYDFYSCEDGTYCSAKTGHCSSGLDNGDWCGGEMVCGDGLFCKSLDDILSVCQPEVPEGHSCWDDICAAGLTCVADKCIYQGRREGQSCDKSNPCGSGVRCIKNRCVTVDIPASIQYFACEI